jgi:uncharacterized protein involved in response to NO
MKHPARTALPTLLAYPFRAFFTATTFAGLLLVPLWLLFLFMPGVSLPALSPLAWHAHEMLGALVNAAIAGFLLTAVCAWTGTAPPARGTLLALLLLWLVGRVAMLLATDPASPWLLLDLAFLPAVAGIVAFRVLRAGQWRQLPLVAILLLHWLADVAYHVSADSRWPAVSTLLVAGLITVIGGRITPLFSANWLRLRGGPAERVRSVPPLDGALLALVLLSVVLLALDVRALPLALVAAACALLGALRLWLWSGWLVWREPLLLVLHLGMLWLVAGYALLACAALGLVSQSVWIHALGAGAMGTMIIGVMARVSLGHTGRPLRASRGVAMAFALVVLAGLLRLATALTVLPWQSGVLVSGAAWVLGFALFARYYLPILTAPRADGKPG